MPTSETLDLAALDEAGFQRLYAETIEPLFQSYEAPRLAAVSAFRTRLAIGAPLALAGAVATFLISGDVAPTLIVGAILGVLSYGVAMMPLQKVAKAVKGSTLDALANAIGVTYLMKDFLPPALARCCRLGLLPSYDRSSFEDHFHGERHGCAFDLYEAHLEDERRDKDGDTSYVTVFRGQIVRIGFPKRFLGVTVVRRDAGLFNAFGAGGKGLERVGLADPEFEKLFEVYSSDQVEARYLVHPVFIERLVELERRFEGKRIRCAFEDGDLLIAVEGGDKFEAGDVFKPIADPERARRIVEEIAQILKLMDAVLTAETAPLLARRPPI